MLDKADSATPPPASHMKRGYCFAPGCPGSVYMTLDGRAWRGHCDECNREYTIPATKAEVELRQDLRQDELERRRRFATPREFPCPTEACGGVMQYEGTMVTHNRPYDDYPDEWYKFTCSGECSMTLLFERHYDLEGQP